MTRAARAAVRCSSGAARRALAVRLRAARPLRAAAPLKRLLALVALSLLALAAPASAQTNVYHIRGNAAAGSNNIWSVNPATGAQTLVYTGYPGGNAATLAQRPSDGMIFYAINAGGGSNGAVYRFNPATPGVAPVLLGTLGGSVLSGFRMAFLGNTLYYMTGGGGADNNVLYTVNQTNGAATNVATITGTGNGGDMAFVGNTLYIINQNRQLYTASTAGGAATLVGTVTFPGGATPGTLGLASDASGRLLIQTQNPSNLYRITLPSLAATLVGALGGGTTPTGDLASAVVPAPDLSVTKTDGVTNTYLGATVTYTVTVRNNGTYTVTGSIIDNVPASLTGVTWTCTASAGSSCAAASGSGNSINTSATLEALDTATYTVTGTVNVSSGTIANTATASVPAWLADATPANNSATDTDNVVAAANVSITKTATSTFAVNQNATYSLAVSNAGPQAAAGTVTVTDTLPAGLTYVSGAGTGWTCGASGAVVTCTHAGPVGIAGSLPNITLTVGVGTAAAPSVTNTASVAATTFDPVSANNSSTITTPVVYFQLNKSVAVNGPQAVPGTDLTYTITFSNPGGVPLSNIIISDKIPVQTQFKIASATYSAGTTGLAAPVVEYTQQPRNPLNENPPNPWVNYAPPGAAGTYDTTITYVRFRFTGNMPAATSGSVTFTVRIL